jgi:hypothetical protein
MEGLYNHVFLWPCRIGNSQKRLEKVYVRAVISPTIPQQILSIFIFAYCMNETWEARILTWRLGDLSSLVASSRLSSNVARCTRVSAVSHARSLAASLESSRNRCCRMLKKGISCGVSASWEYAAFCQTSFKIIDWSVSISLFWICGISIDWPRLIGDW